MSGAPRTSMARIACAASSSVMSRRLTSAKGSWVWSMMPMPAPSGSTQMVRIAWPATFIRLFRLERAAGDRIELFHHGRVARIGRGDQRVVERMVAALLARIAVLRDQRHRRPDEILRPTGIGEQRGDNHLDGDVVVVRMPAIEIGHHRDC